MTGAVTDSLTEEPLPGVNVLVQGTTTGTATNANGEYTVSIEAAIIEQGPDVLETQVWWDVE